MTTIYIVFKAGTTTLATTREVAESVLGALVVDEFPTDEELRYGPLVALDCSACRRRGEPFCPSWFGCAKKEWNSIGS